MAIVITSYCRLRVRRALMLCNNWPRCMKFVFERKSEKSNANWVLTNQNRAIRACVWFFWLAFKCKFYATGHSLRTRKELLSWTVYGDSTLWFSTKQIRTAVTPFWLSADDISLWINHTSFCTNGKELACKGGAGDTQQQKNNALKNNPNMLDAILTVTQFIRD